MASMGKDLDLCSEGRVGGQYVELGYDGGVVVLVIFFGSIVKLGWVKCPLVNEANIVPQDVGSMTVEEPGGERHTLQIGSSETRDDELK
jgi:hypothetical protein